MVDRELDRHIDQVELKMRKIPPFLDIKYDDGKVIRYNKVLIAHSYKGGGWELMYIEPKSGNKLLSVIDSTIQIVADKMLHELNANQNEYLQETKLRNNRRRGRTHRKTSETVS